MSTKKEGKVNEFWGRYRWRITLSRSSSSEARRQKEELILLLNQVRPNLSNPDTPVWRWEKSGNFSVKSAYRMIIDSGCRFRNAKSLWTIKSPLKVRLFLWLVSKNSILTWKNLQKRGWQGPGRCILCCDNGENINHLILSCPFARDLWSLCGAKLEVNFSLRENDSIWDRVGIDGDKKTLRGLILAAICWNIWRERNFMIFNNIFHSLEYCLMITMADIRFWTGLLSDEERLRLSDDSGGYLDHLLTDEELEGLPGPGGGQQTGATPTRDGA